MFNLYFFVIFNGQYLPLDVDVFSFEDIDTCNEWGREVSETQTAETPYEFTWVCEEQGNDDYRS